MKRLPSIKSYKGDIISGTGNHSNESTSSEIITQEDVLEAKTPPNPASPVDQNIPNLSNTTMPILKSTSPRQSFYLENSVPVDSDNEYHYDSDIHSEPEVGVLKDDLIFDDGDERLPPPVASPTFHSNIEPDALAVSSPELESVEGDNFIPDENNSLSPIYRHNTVFSDEYTTESQFTNPGFEQQDSSYYPTPIPAQLMRPPKLSNSTRRNNRDIIPERDFPDTLNWDIKKHEKEIEYYKPPSTSEEVKGEKEKNITDKDNLEDEETISNRENSFSSKDIGLRFNPEDDEIESDIDSDRATIMSNDREDFDNINGTNQGKNIPSNKKKQKNTKKNWIPNIFKRNKKGNLPIATDEMGEDYDASEANVLMSQMSVIDNDLAFTRLDPETIQRHSQMFNVGGIYSGITPRKGATSLIEELEIRKAGKKVQHQVFSREAAEIERQRQEDKDDPNIIPHPVDLINSVQPTLMEMQSIAEADYNSRVKWHTREVNKDYINDHGDETLAQRRARLKAKSSAQNKEGVKSEETLAQRRARLKREKQSQRRIVSTSTFESPA